MPATVLLEALPELVPLEEPEAEELDWPATEEPAVLEYVLEPLKPAEELEAELGLVALLWLEAPLEAPLDGAEM
ncbi:hypothetical protein KL948_005355 [Ogataea haglerorum]|nr:hypothetical protein KL948_005355 [Ogataea haglerorum]